MSACTALLTLPLNSVSIGDLSKRLDLVQLLRLNFDCTPSLHKFYKLQQAFGLRPEFGLNFGLKCHISRELEPET